MKGKWCSYTALAVFILFCLAVTAVNAATPAEIETSVTQGLTWLAGQQHGDGSWGGSAQVSHTGLAVLKMESRALEQGKDPFDPGYLYSANVKNGLGYLFSRVQSDGSIWTDGGHINYETAIAIMAIAESRHPADLVSGTGNANADGKTYQQIVQEAVDYLVPGQMSLGGWGYDQGRGPQDNSNSGYVTLGLVYAENFGITIPTATKTSLSSWVNTIQDPVNGDPDDGGSWYRPPADGNWPWVNILKTGNLLFEQKMVGRAPGDAPVQAAVGYIGTHWNDATDSSGYRMLLNPPNYQAAFTTMKGLESYQLTAIPVGGNPNFDWFDSLATMIVANQNPDGSWTGDNWGDNVLTTSWALLTLERTVVIPVTFETDKSASAPVVHEGDTVTYTYLVKNTGIVPISGVILTDDQLGQVAGPASGDTNGNTILDPGETWVYSTMTTLSATTTNTATASGLDPENAVVSTDPSTPVTVTVIHPGMAIAKTASATLIAPGDPVTYTYTVTNTGDVALTAVTVTDSVLGVIPGPASGDTNNNGELDLTEVWIYEITVNPAATVTNTATASSTDPLEAPVSGSSDSVIVVVNQPPDTSTARPSLACVWPPDNKFVDMTIDGVTDPDNDPVTLTVTAITSDEATASAKGAGGPQNAPDASGVGTSAFSVRAERSGNENGRVYVISFTADDGRPGGISTGTVTVCVPHDQSASCSCTDDGQNYDATTKN